MMNTTKHNILTILLALSLSAVNWTAQAEGFDAKGIGPAGEPLNAEQLENEPTPSEAEAQVFDQDQVDRWADYWADYAEQFSPRSYRRDVIQDACSALQESVQNSDDAAKLTACFNQLRSLQIRTPNDYLQELAENTGLDGDEKPYFCPKQYPDPETGPRCLPTREFGMRGAWIHTHVNNASPAHTDTNFSYEVLSGDCTISVAGVITPQPGPCVVQASERINAGLTLQSEPLELIIVEDRCLVDNPVVVTASNTEPNVGDRIQVSAAGGELVMCQTGNNNYRYFATPASCRIDENGEAFATSAGDCTFKAYAAEAVNDDYLGTLTVSFSDPESSSETGGLTISLSEQNPAAGATVDVIVQGAGNDEVLFSASPSLSCQIASNGRLTTSGDVTCRIAARTTGSGKTGAICQNFGQGGIYPPDECLPTGFYDGPLLVDNPRGIVGAANQQPIQLQARGGGSGRTITWSLAEANNNCQISSQGQVSATANTVCKVRAYKNDNYSSNVYCAAFGSTLDAACTTENAGGTDIAELGVEASGPTTGIALGSEVTLTATGLGMALADFHIENNGGNHCFVSLSSGGSDGTINATSAVIGNRANLGDGLCRVRVTKQGYPENPVYACLAYGSAIISDEATCSGGVPDTELTVTSSSDSAQPGESITISATVNRGLIQNESFMIRGSTNVGPVNSPGGEVVPGCTWNEDNFRSTSGPFSRTISCPDDRTIRVQVDFDKRIDNPQGEDITEYICLTFGAGSTNAHCAQQQAQAGGTTFLSDLDRLSVSLSPAHLSSVGYIATTLDTDEEGEWPPTWRITWSYNANQICSNLYKGIYPIQLRDFDQRTAKYKLNSAYSRNEQNYSCNISVTITDTENFATKRINSCLSFNEGRCADLPADSTPVDGPTDWQQTTS